jgi:protein-S-isoprenylcysteine O-methyltransferase Ste14
MNTIISLLPLLFFFSEVSLLIMKRTKSGEVKIRKDKSSLLILWITILTSLFLGIYLSVLYPGNERFLFLIYAGAFILFIGAVIRWIAIYQLRKEFTVDVSISKNHKIKDDGLYKNIRHPSYLGLLLEFFGLSLLYNNWFSILIINIPIIIAVAYRIKIEEELLTGAFGIEYENYKQRTKRILPGIF